MNTPSTSTTSFSTTLITPTPTNTTSSSSQSPTFTFPKTHSFPPFFTLQPTTLTLQAQLRKWSDLIQSYCRYHKLYQLAIVEAASTPLFTNNQIKKRLAEPDIRTVIDYMASVEGDQRAEWTTTTTTTGTTGKAKAWIWWRKPEEWGNLIREWVDETGQKGSVLTFYEIVEGEATEGQDFHGMDMEVLQKSLNVLVKKGKAQVFGQEDQLGVKFF